MRMKKLLALFATTAVVAVACSSSATSAPSAAPASAAPVSAAAAGNCTVGVSWNNYQEERWAKWDEPAIKAALEAGGA